MILSRFSLEQRLKQVESENTQHAETIQQQADTILRLQATLKQYAEAKSPKFGLNYISNSLYFRFLNPQWTRF